MEEFENKVKETHGGNEYGLQYMAAIEYVKKLQKIWENVNE